MEISKELKDKSSRLLKKADNKEFIKVALEDPETFTEYVLNVLDKREEFNNLSDEKALEGINVMIDLIKQFHKNERVVNSCPNEVLDTDEVNSDRDYLRFVSKSSTKEHRKKFRIGDTFINGIACKKCNTWARSKNAYHFASCECGACSVDGGSGGPSMIRHIGDPEDYIIINEEFYDK